MEINLRYARRFGMLIVEEIYKVHHIIAKIRTSGPTGFGNVLLNQIIGEVSRGIGHENA